MPRVRTVFHFLLILIHSAWLEMLGSAQSCLSFVPHCSNSFLNTKGLRNSIPLGCHAEQSPYPDVNDGKRSIIWDRWVSRNYFSAQLFA